MLQKSKEYPQSAASTETDSNLLLHMASAPWN